MLRYPIKLSYLYLTLALRRALLVDEIHPVCQIHVPLRERVSSFSDSGTKSSLCANRGCSCRQCLLCRRWCNSLLITGLVQTAASRDKRCLSQQLPSITQQGEESTEITIDRDNLIGGLSPIIPWIHLKGCLFRDAQRDLPLYVCC